MSDELLQEIRCPNCQSTIQLQGHGQTIVCEACNSQFLLSGHLCPNCQTYHRKETGFCGRCGKAMSRVCGRCQTNNWAGNEYCQNCGEAMDIIDLVTRRHKDAVREQQDRRRLEIARMKQQEEEASRKRMGELMEMERLRMEELKRRLVKERARQQRMLTLTFGLVALFLVIIALYALLNAIG
jgi:hypothetical protein